jgi:hypothetical protein
MTTSPVTSVTDELIDELELLASKATKGEWWIDSHGHKMVSHDADGTHSIFQAMDIVNPAVRHPETGNLSHWPNDWDASFIATANPATILALLSERAELKREIGGLRASRIAYASEFPLTDDGDPDTGSIHASIRKLKRDAERYDTWMNGCFSSPAEMAKILGPCDSREEVDAALDAMAARKC